MHAVILSALLFRHDLFQTLLGTCLGTCLESQDLLNKLTDEEKVRAAQWVGRLQVYFVQTTLSTLMSYIRISHQVNKLEQTAPGGFRGSPFYSQCAARCVDDSGESDPALATHGLSKEDGLAGHWDLGHLAMTYTALAILRICMQPSSEGIGVGGELRVAREVEDVVATVNIEGVSVALSGSL
jgi:hypothetical protein